MTMDRSELQRLHVRAVGGARRYWCDGLVQDLLTALGKYLEQPDETVEIAYVGSRGICRPRRRVD